jgi:cytochrome c-type biogenesis protein CcmH
MAERSLSKRLAAAACALLLASIGSAVAAQKEAGAPASTVAASKVATPPDAATNATNATSAAAATPSDEAAASASTVRFAPPAAVPTAADPLLEARMLAITGELRCLVCQNQTIADSHADLAVDLRQEVREMLKRGQSDDQIRRYMTDRYGDFILYRPPLKPTTLVLWLGPALLLAIAISALVVVIARRGKLADDRFEPDPVWDDDAGDGADPRHASRPSSIPPARPGAPA